MSRLVVACLVLALLGLAPATADAGKKRKSFVLYEDVALDAESATPSVSIRTASFSTVMVLGQATGDMTVACYFTDESVDDPRDAAGVLAFAAEAYQDQPLFGLLWVTLFEPKVPLIPVVADYFQCLAYGEGIFRATLVAQ